MAGTPLWWSRVFRSTTAAGLLALTVAACGRAGERLSIEPLEPPVAAETGLGSADPALAVDPESGDLLLSWIAGDSTNHELYFARSADAGRSWSAPVRVTDRRGDVHPHGEGSPRLVAAPEGVVAIFWNNRIVVEGRRFAASDMRFSRSTDRGRSWSPARTLQDDTLEAPRGHTFHGAAWVGDSELVVAWLDGRDREREIARAQASGHGAHTEHSGGDATIYLARSPDLGATWAAANQRAWDAVCPCCRVTLARGPGGAVTAAWRKHFPGSVRDVVVAPLAAPPAEPLRVAADGWEFPGCPHTGPGVAVDDAGGTHVAWYTGKAGRAGVFYARSPGANGTAAFAEPLALVSAETFPVAHPVVAALPGGGALVAYDVGDDGERALVLAAIDRQGRQVERTTLPDSRGADHPQLVALGDGTAVVAWAGDDGEGPRIRLARVRVSR